MKLTLLVKDVAIKTLVSGDKSARITLESLNYKDVERISKIANEMEVDVEFDIEGKRK